MWGGSFQQVSKGNMFIDGGWQPLFFIQNRTIHTYYICVANNCFKYVGVSRYLRCNHFSCTNCTLYFSYNTQF